MFQDYFHNQEENDAGLDSENRHNRAIAPHTISGTTSNVVQSYCSESVAIMPKTTAVP